MAFPDTTPRKGDSDNNLLFKIAQELSERNGGAFPPMLGDSDNNLLYKIAQLIILGGGTAGTCAADLAAAQASLATCSAALATCQAQVIPQDMQVAWTPTNLKLGEMLGYGVGGTVDYPGITSLTFKGASSLGGFTLSQKTTILSIAFSNLVSSSATITIANGTVLNSVTAPVLSTVAGNLVITGNNLITSFSFPALSSFTGTGSFILTSTGLTSVSAPSLVSTSGNVTLSANAALTSVTLTSLTTVSGTISFASDTSLVTLSLPALVTGGAGGGFTMNGCTALTTVSFPSLLPTNARNYNFGTCALTQASVDHVLARCVANAAYVSGTVTLNGGTNSTPSAAGLANKAILVSRGVTVLNN